MRRVWFEPDATGACVGAGLAAPREPLLNTMASAAPVPTTKMPSATTAANREAGDAAGSAAAKRSLWPLEIGPGRSSSS